VEEVVGQPIPESQETVTQDDSDITTWKKRLAGKDQALTATKKQLDEVKAEYEKVQTWKIQMEESSLTEFERAQRKIESLEKELRSTRESEAKSRLAKDYPNYVQWQEKAAELTDEDRAREFEAMIATGGKTAEYFVDPNKPAKATPAAAGKRNASEIVKDIAALGNPWGE